MENHNLFEKLTQHPEVTTLLIGLSGGLDSRVLLDLCVSDPKLLEKYQLKVVHVNHSIHTDADRWSQHCESLCRTLPVSFHAEKLTINKNKGESLEAAAREARYQCFAKYMDSQTCLLTAHHADDQAETCLLQLLRGSGVAGLAAMPLWQAFAGGYHFRPLLMRTREKLLAYAEEKKLTWFDDPSNTNVAFDRNFLRAEIMPRLKTRWPSAAKTLTRSSLLCAEAEVLLQEVAGEDLERVSFAIQTIDMRKFNQLAKNRQANVIRHWLDTLNFPMPSQIKLKEIIRSVFNSDYDANPLVQYDEVAVRRFRYEVFALTVDSPIDETWSAEWNAEEDFILPYNLGILWAEDFKIFVREGPLTICFRQKGMRVKLANRQGHHKMKSLFQAWGVPLWLRNRTPLVLQGDLLLCVTGFYAPSNVQEISAGL